MKPLVIYHGNCQDGFTAAWAIWKVHPDWDFYPAKHGDPPPDVTDKNVYMVDFSYKRPVILEMASKANIITILDHHQTAQAELVDLPDNVIVQFDMNKSGAMLTWEYFHNSDVPELVKHVQDRDLWKFKLDGTKELSMYIFSLNYDFSVWENLYKELETTEGINSAQLRGQAILDKQAKDTEELSSNKQLITISGHKVWAVNVPYTFSSDMGHLLSQGELFAATYYIDNKNRINFSLRSQEDGLDVSEIAKKYGGGGHKHAAGFSIPATCPEVLFSAISY